MSGERPERPPDAHLAHVTGTAWLYVLRLEAYADAADALIKRVGQHLPTTQAVADFHIACDECAAWGKTTEDKA